MTNELLARLALQFQPNIGGTTIKKLLQHYGSARAIFAEKSKVSPLGKRVPLPRLTVESQRLAEEELRWMERQGIRLCFWTDADFPKRLLSCSDSPYMFYYQGNNIFNEPRAVAVVGTRNVSPYGKDATRKIIGEMARHDVCVVSGLARGIDTVAHEQALDSGLKTVAVMGCGLSTIYPDSNIRLARRIVENGGALVSEFPFKTKPDRQNFPQRNRIIAGMTDATLVMETAQKGGSIITAYIAHSYNRDVFAVPGSILAPSYEGCHTLIRKNVAAIATSGADVAELMGWDLPSPKGVQRSLFIELSEDEQVVADLIATQKEFAIDDLTAAMPQHTPSKLAALLLQLELKGVVRCNPGKTYSLVAG
ncbi:MAG: DNA-processing protein DprA [Bacteroidales bacterium]|nr:DNA-processing protein DprA [Bacteroidales bacterium]